MSLIQYEMSIEYNFSEKKNKKSILNHYMSENVTRIDTPDTAWLVKNVFT